MAYNKKLSRISRHRRVRKKVSGSGDRPRLCVFRSAKHIYAQLVNDDDCKTIVGISTLNPEIKSSVKNGGNMKAASAVGKAIAEKAQALGIKKICFDRSGFLYHGRIKALADAAREAGLDF